MRGTKTLLLTSLIAFAPIILGVIGYFLGKISGKQKLGAIIGVGIGLIIIVVFIGFFLGFLSMPLN